MKILLVDDDPDILEILTLNMETKFGFDVVRAQSGKSAIQVLKQNPDIEYIISDYDMQDGNGGMLYQYVQSQDRSIPFLLCTSAKLHDCPEFEINPPEGYLEKPFLWKDMMEKIQSTFKILPEEEVSRSVKYSSVLISGLKRANTLYCDFYVKISENKYIKVFKKGDSFSSSDFTRYTAKNIVHLFVRQEDSDIFLEQLTNSIYSLMKNKDLPWEASYDLLEDAHHSVYETLHSFGFTPKAQELARQSARLAIKTAMSRPALAKMFVSRQNSSAHFLNSHSIFLAHLSALFALIMKWDSEETLYKVSIAAILHDLSIKDHLNAMLELYLHSHQNLRSFDPAVVTALKEHPQQSGRLAKEISDLPKDVYEIILQHHERPDGEGFPLGLKANQIGPLSALIIIAQDLANYIWLNDANSSLPQFLKEYGRAYLSDHFLKIFNQLENYSHARKPS